jgi:hypothetical protein
MIDRTLFIHAGGSKTGSSALQSFLEINVTRLESHGFAYEHRLNIKSENQITSGNGEYLYNALKVEHITDVTIDSLVLSYFGKSNNAICSSEYFQLLPAQSWRKLQESSIRLGVTLNVIFYVRNVIPFLQSSYGEAIKRFGEYRLFGQWIVESDWGHYSSLKVIADEVPFLNIQVRHFDRVRKNLIHVFLSALGIDPLCDFWQEVQIQQVNRSLTNLERDILIKVNSFLGNAYTNELSDLFVYASPLVRGELVSYDKKTEQLLLNRFSSEVDWINNAFFNGQAAVTVLPMGSEIKQEQNLMVNQTQNNATEKQVLNWALEKLKTIQSETECRILDALNNAVSQNASKNYPPEIPADFDVLAYLLLNRDVLHAGMDPMQHYINHGKTEGRKYRF